MAIESGFFNSVNGDRKYNAEDMSRYFEHILSSGLFEHIENCMLVTAAGGMDIAVAPGAGLIDCHWFRMNTTETLTIGTANAALPRIDAVVLRMDTADSVRAITLQVIAGTPAASPVAYVPQTSETSAEIVIAHVYVPAAASSIAADNITDTREDESICGWVRSLVSLTDAPLLRRMSCQHTAATNGATTFPITAAAYVPAADTVNVYVNGFYMTSGIDYTVDKEACTITLAVGVDAGTLVTIEVYKSISPDHVPEAVETFGALVDDVAALKASMLSGANLLDNSNFMQFIAQAGIAGKHGAQAYAGDRWKLISGSVTGTANANGNGYGNIALNGTIAQTVADAPDTATPFIVMISGTAEISYENGVVTITSAGGVIDHAALYDGAFSVIPYYVAKDYTAELAECKRYFRALFGEQSYEYCYCGQAISETRALVPVPLDVPMCGTPSITWTANVGITNSTGSVIAASEITVNKACNNAVTLDIVTVGTLVPGNATLLSARDAASQLYLSCDL